MLNLLGCGPEYTGLCSVDNNGTDVKILCQKEIDGFGDARSVQQRDQYNKLESLKNLVGMSSEGIELDLKNTGGKQIVGKYLPGASTDRKLDWRIYFNDGTNGVVKIR